MLTGEPLPVDRGPGSAVTGGTRNGSGVLVVRVSSVAAESVLARLQRLVEDAQRDKAPLQRLADRISSVFVPAVLLGALVTFLAWALVVGNVGKAVLSGLAVLLVACPCAMGLAAPVAMMVGCGRAAAVGIFIRSGDVLERLAKVDAVVFDKTGTLTERHAEVSLVAAAPRETGEEVWLWPPPSRRRVTTPSPWPSRRPHRRPGAHGPPTSSRCRASGCAARSTAAVIEVSRLVPSDLPASMDDAGRRPLRAG